MPNNWAEWDKEHGRGGDGGRSADKLAAMIKGTLGHTAAPAPAHGSHGSVVHKTTKKDMKRPAPVKGEKDRADSMRTQIRMAAYQRKKAGAVGQDPVNKTTPKVEQKVNPHTPTSAEKLISDRDRRIAEAGHRNAVAQGKMIEAGHQERVSRLGRDWKTASDAEVRGEHSKTSAELSRYLHDPAVVRGNGRGMTASDLVKHRAAMEKELTRRKLDVPARPEHSMSDADLRRSSQVDRTGAARAEINRRKSAPAATPARSAEKLVNARDERTAAPRDGVAAMKLIKSKRAAGMSDEEAHRQQLEIKQAYTAQRAKAATASAKAELSGSAADHQAAADEHMRAAVMSTTAAQRAVHANKVKQHQAEVSAPKASAAPEAARQSRYEKIAADAERLSAQSEADLDNGPHRDAAEAHRAAAAATTDPAAKAGHEAAAKTMDRRAKSAETLARTRGIAEAKKAAPPPRAPGQSAGDRYRQLHQVRLDAAAGIRNSIDKGTGEIDYLHHSTIASKAEAEQNKLWPKLTSRDIAESVMQKSPGVDPHLHEMLTAELAKHIEYTGRNHSWKGITLDVAKIPPRENGQRVGAHTVGGNHIVLNSDFLYRPGGGPVPNFNGFREHFHSAGPMGRDEYADTRHILAHEIGHTQHYAITRVTRSQGDQEAHDLLGPHVHSATSRYGTTNTHEKAAEAYTASFARAHGHQEYMKAAADAGDHLVRQVKQKRGNS